MRKQLACNHSTRFHAPLEVLYTFGDDAQKSINKLQPFDSDPNIFIMLAHDSVLFDILPLFNDHPDLDVNDWQQKGYKGQTHWGFLNGLPPNNRPGRKPIVDGLRRNGKLLVNGDDGNFHEHVAEVNKPHCEHENPMGSQGVGVR